MFHYEEREKRSGITTELAGVATFLLALLAATGDLRLGEPIALATAILIAAFLEAKQRLQHLLRETITEPEFNATLAFITLVAGDLSAAAGGSFGRYSSFPRARCGCSSSSFPPSPMSVTSSKNSWAKNAGWSTPASSADSPPPPPSPCILRV